MSDPWLGQQEILQRDQTVSGSCARDPNVICSFPAFEAGDSRYPTHHFALNALDRSFPLGLGG